MYQLKKIFFKSFLLIFLLTIFCLQSTKDPNIKIFYKISFLLESSFARVCIFKIQKNELNSTHVCSSEFALKKDFCRVFYFSTTEQNLSKQKIIHSYFLKTLSELELNHPILKTELHSILIFSYEKEFLNKEKEFQKEFESSLKKYKLNLQVVFLKEEDELKDYSENLEQGLFLLHTMKESQSKFLFQNPQTTKDLQFKEDLSPFLIAKQNEDKKEFIACRQALSEKVRSTGNSGVENAINCKGLIFNAINQSKVFPNIQKLIREQQIKTFYLQGEVWEILKEIENSENLIYFKLLEKQKDYCYLSPMELIKQYKISKQIAKSACYSLIFGISFLDYLNIEEGKVLNQNEFLRYASVQPKFAPECNLSPLLPSKKK